MRVWEMVFELADGAVVVALTSLGVVMVAQISAATFWC